MNIESLMSTLFGDLDSEAMLQSLREVIAEPTSNLTLSVLLVAVVSLVLLIIVVGILMLIAGDDDEDDEDDDVLAVAPTPAASVAKPPRAPIVAPDSRLGRVVAVLGAALVPLLLVVAFVASYGISAQDRYCLTCHEVQLATIEPSAEPSSSASFGADDEHADARCIDCHEEGQITGAVGNSLDRARHLAAYASGSREGRGGSVASERCMECHEDITDNVVTDEARGVRMSHKEPLAAGVACTECHRDSGHRTDVLEPGMSACLKCHDGQTASAECDTCHTKETSFAARDRRIFGATQTIERRDCSGCHAQDTCDSCHGLRMPHGEEFLAYGHAREAGFDKKELCWRCHSLQDCGKCHSVRERSIGYWGHTTGDTFKQQHATMVPPGEVAGCGCHGRSPWVKRGEDYCLACHEEGIR